jgi:PAS domain-containing protein
MSEAESTLAHDAADGGDLLDLAAERVRELDALYRVADAIGRATSLVELLDESIDTLLEATGADRAAVLLYDDDNVMRFRAWRGLSDEYRAATEGHVPWAVDTVDPQPVLISDASQADFDERAENVIRREGIASLAFIPLVHGDRLVGKFMLYHDEVHEWGDGEIRLAGTIANHLASTTIRTNARVALRESRELLEMIMRTVDEGVVVQSAEGGIVYANDGAARVIGFETAADFIAADRHEVLNRFEILDEDGNPLPADQLPGRRALRGESSERVVRYRVLETGAERWSFVRANPVFGDNGSVEFAISVIHDITMTRARAERVRFLARASELLNETLEIESTLGALADIAVPAVAGHLTLDHNDSVL